MFAHHDPAIVIQHHLAALITTDGIDVNHTALAVRVFLKPDHGRYRTDRIARIDRRAKHPTGITKIGNRI